MFRPLPLRPFSRLDRLHESAVSCLYQGWLDISAPFTILLFRAMLQRLLVVQIPWRGNPVTAARMVHALHHLCKPGKRRLEAPRVRTLYRTLIRVLSKTFLDLTPTGPPAEKRVPLF